MKKWFSLLIYLLFVGSFYPQNLNWSPFGTVHKDSTVIYSDDSIYCRFWTSLQLAWTYKNRKIIENGFVRINSKMTENTDRMYVLEGKNVIIFERYYFPWDWSTYAVLEESVFDFPMIYKDSTLEEWQSKKYSRTKEHITKEGWNRVILYEDGIDSVRASSFLEENQKDGSTVAYNAENINDTLFFVTSDGSIDLYYDNKTPPWVEGVEGYGIGEYLDVEFKYASDEMQILNGFVDFSRMHLYKDNSRVKRILIESEEPAFSKEYELEDVVRYNVLTLPSKTTKIRMTILDVYPGRKWQDTCISSILVTDPNQPPYEEQKKKIIALMKDNGVWEKIEEFKKQLRNEAK